MDSITTELVLRYGLAGIVIIGLVAAIRMLRAEHADREKTWNARLDEKEKQYSLLQNENVVVLKDDLKSRAQNDTRLEAIEKALQEIQTLNKSIYELLMRLYERLNAPKGG